jgi:hypothetical protein
VGEFSSSRLFMPSSLKLKESAYKRGDAGFTVFLIKPSPKTSLERRFHWKVEEVTKRTSLESNTSDNLSVIGA